jgi:proteasome lid subunit RPN8/RPN11
MTKSNGERGLVRWQADDGRFTVEYAGNAMEAVRAEVVEGFYRLARGGLEVGGVLFGERQGDSVRILASRPLVCEHAFGPSFVLSEKDMAALNQLLLAATSDPGLKGLTPVGWYHSHTRSEILLSAQDQAIFDQFFPEPWQVSLVLSPHKLKPTRARFFYRGAGREMDAVRAGGELTLEPLLRRRKPPAARLPVETPAEAVPPMPPPAPRRWSRLPWSLFALAWCVAFAAGGFALRDYWWPGEPAPLTLHLADANGQLTIRWEHETLPLRQAEGGVLEITDAGRKSVIRLDAEEVRQGSLTYSRQSGEVSLQMKVALPRSRISQGRARFVGPPPPGGK